MFDDYAKKLKDIGADVPAVFETVAKNGAIKARNEAVKITDKEKLVDTGNYRRNWHGKAVELSNEAYGVQLENGVEYASHLEYGYSIKKDHFVPFEKMKGTPKAKALVNDFKSKYPNAKGFIAKARRFKGRFIGRQALDETRYYCIQKLDETFDKLFRAYHEKFTKPD